MTKAIGSNYNNIHFLEMAKHRLMLEEFLVKKSNLNVRDNEGRNALYWAIKNRHKHNVSLLMKYGIDLVVANDIHAIFHAIDSIDIETFIHLLESKKVSIDMQNSRGETLLMRAIQVEAIYMVRYLIHHGANLYLVDNTKKRAIDYAKLAKNRDMFNIVHYRILSEQSKGLLTVKQQS